MDRYRSVPNQVRGRAVDASQRARLEPCREPRNGARGPARTAPRRCLRAALHAPAQRTSARRRCRIVEERTRMSLAEEFTPVEEDEPEAQARPEELRLLEALLFAAGEP